MENQEKYIDKKSCVRQGFVHSKGGVCKMTLLERYALRGWLELGNPRYSKEDRLKAAECLQQDFERSCFMSGSVFSAKEKVDCKGKSALDIEFICKARERYFRAVKHVPDEFWPVVKSVCLENREPETDVSKSRWKSEMNYAMRRDLCRGLDRLIQFYWNV